MQQFVSNKKMPTQNAKEPQKPRNKLINAKKIFESNCKFSRSDDSNWIISVATTKLMTKDYHDAFEKNYPKKRIKKFDFNQIKSYLFSSGF